jgi:hypothetical protein
MASPNLADLGPGTPQLVCDDAMLAYTDNVWRSLHHPAKHADNPVLEPDRPWEGYLVLQPGTVIYDEDASCFRMWYNSQPTRDTPDAGHNLCYATSTDGVHWEKPELGLTEFAGSTANNILLRGPVWTHCVLDDAEEADPGRRYKLLYWGWPSQPDRKGIHASFSPDGIHWNPYEEKPIVPTWATGDTFSVLRDPASGRYWLYHKTPGEPIRTISRMVSDDFIHWRDSRRVLGPDPLDPPDTQFYGLSAYPSGGQYLGLLWVYHTYLQTMDVQLVSSRDGLHWDRTADRKLLVHLEPTNNYPGHAFDSRMIYPASAPAAWDDRLWLYYSGFTVPHNAHADDHDGCIGLATTRQDGLCSLDATSQGVVVTKPFRWKGAGLRLNASVRPEADSSHSDQLGPTGIRVQIEDERGEPIPRLSIRESLPFCGDQTEAQVDWKERSDLSDLNGQIVQLRFVMNYARLYAWRIVR